MANLKERENFFKIRLEELRKGAAIDYRTFVAVVKNVLPYLKCIELEPPKNVVEFKQRPVDISKDEQVPLDGPKNHMVIFLPPSKDERKYLFASASFFLYGGYEYQTELLVRTVCLMVENEKHFTSLNVVPVYRILFGEARFFTTKYLQEKLTVNARFKEHSQNTIEGLYRMEILSMIEKDFTPSGMWQIIALQELLGEFVRIWSVFPEGLVEFDERNLLNTILTPLLSQPKSANSKVILFPIYWKFYKFGNCSKACERKGKICTKHCIGTHLPMVNVNNEERYLNVVFDGYQNAIEHRGSAVLEKIQYAGKRQLETESSDSSHKKKPNTSLCRDTRPRVVESVDDMEMPIESVCSNSETGGKSNLLINSNKQICSTKINDQNELCSIFYIEPDTRNFMTPASLVGSNKDTLVKTNEYGIKSGLSGLAVKRFKEMRPNNDSTSIRFFKVSDPVFNVIEQDQRSAKCVQAESTHLQILASKTRKFNLKVNEIEKCSVHVNNNLSEENTSTENSSENISRVENAQTVIENIQEKNSNDGDSLVPMNSQQSLSIDLDKSKAIYINSKHRISSDQTKQEPDNEENPDTSDELMKIDVLGVANFHNDGNVLKTQMLKTFTPQEIEGIIMTPQCENKHQSESFGVCVEVEEYSDVVNMNYSSNAEEIYDGKQMDENMHGIEVWTTNKKGKNVKSSKLKGEDRLWTEELSSENKLNDYVCHGIKIETERVDVCTTDGVVEIGTVRNMNDYVCNDIKIENDADEHLDILLTSDLQFQDKRSETEIADISDFDGVSGKTLSAPDLSSQSKANVKGCVNDLFKVKKEDSENCVVAINSNLPDNGNEYDDGSMKTEGLEYMKEDNVKGNDENIIEIEKAENFEVSMNSDLPMQNLVDVNEDYDCSTKADDVENMDEADMEDYGDNIIKIENEENEKFDEALMNMNLPFQNKVDCDGHDGSIKSEDVEVLVECTPNEIQIKTLEIIENVFQQRQAQDENLRKVDSIFKCCFICKKILLHLDERERLMYTFKKNQVYENGLGIKESSMKDTEEVVTICTPCTRYIFLHKTSPLLQCKIPKHLQALNAIEKLFVQKYWMFICTKIDGCSYSSRSQVHFRLYYSIVYCPTRKLLSWLNTAKCHNNEILIELEDGNRYEVIRKLEILSALEDSRASVQNESEIEPLVLKQSFMEECLDSVQTVKSSEIESLSPKDSQVGSESSGISEIASFENQDREGDSVDVKSQRVDIEYKDCVKIDDSTGVLDKDLFLLKQPYNKVQYLDDLDTFERIQKDLLTAYDGCGFNLEYLIWATGIIQKEKIKMSITRVKKMAKSFVEGSIIILGKEIPSHDLKSVDKCQNDGKVIEENVYSFLTELDFLTSTLFFKLAGEMFDLNQHIQDFAFMNSCLSPSHFLNCFESFLSMMIELGTPTVYIKLIDGRNNWIELFSAVNPTHEGDWSENERQQKSAILLDQPSLCVVYFIKQFYKVMELLVNDKVFGSVLDYIAWIDFDNEGNPFVHLFLWYSYQDAGFMLHREENDVLFRRIGNLEVQTHIHAGKCLEFCEYNYLDVCNITVGKKMIVPYIPVILETWKGQMFAETYVSKSKLASRILELSKKTLMKFSDVTLPCPIKGSVQKILQHVFNNLHHDQESCILEATFFSTGIQMFYGSRDFLIIPQKIPVLSSELESTKNSAPKDFELDMKLIEMYAKRSPEYRNKSLVEYLCLKLHSSYDCHLMKWEIQSEKRPLCLKSNILQLCSLADCLDFGLRYSLLHVPWQNFSLNRDEIQSVQQYPNYVLRRDEIIQMVRKADQKNGIHPVILELKGKNTCIENSRQQYRIGNELIQVKEQYKNMCTSHGILLNLDCETAPEKRIVKQQLNISDLDKKCLNTNFQDVHKVLDHYFTKLASDSQRVKLKKNLLLHDIVLDGDLYLAKFSVLNASQYTVFLEIVSQLSENLEKEHTNPYRVLVNGCSGSGKTYLLQILRTYVQRNIDADVLVLAPTPSLAQVAQGVPFHHLYNLNTLMYPDLFSRCILFIDAVEENNIGGLDEVSRVLSKLSCQSSDVVYGKMDVIIFSDLLRVSDYFQVFSQDSSGDSVHKVMKVLELEERINTVFDKDYSVLLSNCRNGTVTSGDSLLVNKAVNKSENLLMKICTNESIRNQRLARSLSDAPVIFKEEKLDVDDPSDSIFLDHIPEELSVFSGMMVILMKNYNSKDGLTFGTRGVVDSIIVDDRNVAVGIRVKFFDIPSEKMFLNDTKNLQEPVEIKKECFRRSTKPELVVRQLPVTYGTYVTVDMIKGLVYNKAFPCISDIDKVDWMLYQMLSRVYSFKGLFLLKSKQHLKHILEQAVENSKMDVRTDSVEEESVTGGASNIKEIMVIDKTSKLNIYQGKQNDESSVVIGQYECGIDNTGIVRDIVTAGCGQTKFFVHQRPVRSVKVPETNALQLQLHKLKTMSEEESLCKCDFRVLNKLHTLKSFCLFELSDKDYFSTMTLLTEPQHILFCTMIQVLAESEKSCHRFIVNGCSKSGKTYLLHLFKEYYLRQCSSTKSNILILESNKMPSYGYDSNKVNINIFLKHYNESIYRNEVMDSIDIIAVDGVSLDTRDSCKLLEQCIENYEAERNRKIVLVLCGDLWGAQFWPGYFQIGSKLLKKFRNCDKRIV